MFQKCEPPSLVWAFFYYPFARSSTAIFESKANVWNYTVVLVIVFVIRVHELPVESVLERKVTAGRVAKVSDKVLKRDVSHGEVIGKDIFHRKFTVAIHQVGEHIAHGERVFVVFTVAVAVTTAAEQVT